MYHVNVINFSFVFFFGFVLSISFADIESKNNKMQYALILCVLGSIQIIAYLIFGEIFLFKSYPFLMHLPLFLLLKFYYKKSGYIAGISILSAYLFCTPRKWIGTAISFFWNYDMGVSYIVQIVITIPLLMVIVHYVSPYVARLKFESNKILKFFIMVPLIYYVLEYILTVYTNLLYRGGAVVVEFMDAAVVVVYFIFSIVYLKTLYEKNKVEVEQALFKVLADQSKAEIEALRKSEKQAVIYRHDLRHHMNYLNTCISENNIEDALSYITNVCEEIDSTKVIRYSGNESVNLILSSYIAKAEEKKIHSEISISTVVFGRLSVPDLCSLLSNALENAIQACENITDSNKRHIKLRMYSKNNKLCIDLRNIYQTEPIFHQGFPVSTEQGHGFGTKSMAYVVEKYGGLCQFSVNDGWFIFQAIT
jgi:hypothetical protein